MPTDHRRARIFLDRLLQDHSLDELRERLKPKDHNPAAKMPRRFRNFIGTVKLPVSLAEYATEDQVRAFAHALATRTADRGQP